MEKRIKTYSDTYVYNKGADQNGSMERNIIEYIRTAQRVNKDSSAFEQIKNQVKVRQTTAVLYRILMRSDVALCIGKAEAPASFKVFMAKDLLSNARDKKVFIDVTGILTLNNGFYVCKEIDKLCAYLMGALVTLMYYNNNQKLIDNAIVAKMSTGCFLKMFTAILDNLKVSNFSENRIKVSYITAVYYLNAVMGKPLDSARNYAASVLGINLKDASGYDYWYNPEEDFKSIDTFITFLANNFKLNGLTTDIFIVRYMQMYGKGVIFSLELLPSFLITITNAYSGSFINSQKTIEKICGKEMVTLSTELLRMGAELYSTGFNYESVENREFFERFIEN